MSNRKRGGKAQIHMSVPEPPPFLQRMREQIVANENAERQEQSERRRSERPKRRIDDDDDDPTVVKLRDNDLTEEEYKRMKLDMETQYTIESANITDKKKEIDFDKLFDTNVPNMTSSSRAIDKAKSRDMKKLSFGTTSDEDED